MFVTFLNRGRGNLCIYKNGKNAIHSNCVGCNDQGYCVQKESSCNPSHQYCSASRIIRSGTVSGGSGASGSGRLASGYYTRTLECVHTTIRMYTRHILCAAYGCLCMYGYVCACGYTWYIFMCFLCLCACMYVCTTVCVAM